MNTRDEVNLNDYVWVRLTEKGRKILREEDEAWSKLFANWYGRLPLAEAQAAETGGWSRWQLWSLIEAFGAHIGLGSNPPFETTIRLSEPPRAGTVDELFHHSATPSASAAPITSPDLE